MVFEANETIEERYQLQQKLRDNSTDRQTWLAIDLDSQEEVRVKLLALSPGTSEEQMKLFKQEARVLRTLDHPQILKYRDYFDINMYDGGGVVWFGLVQDYVKGTSVLKLLEAGKKFSQKELQNFATQILDILIYLHQLKPAVLHLDVKPANMILAEDGKIYLVGFGIIEAKAAARGICFNTIGGDGYTPLEQFLGQPVPASDLYGLAASLIHLATGISPAELPQSGSHLEFADRVKLDPHFIAWLEKNTNVDPNRRFNTATEAKKVLLSEKKSASLFSNSQGGRSQIKLNKSNSVLRIDIPNSHLITWRDYAIVVFLLALKLSVFKQLFLFDLNVNYSVWFMLIIPILTLYVLVFIFEGTKLYLSEEKLSVEKYIFGITYFKKRFSYNNIVNFNIQPYQEVLPGLVRLFKKITVQTKDGIYDLAKIPRGEKEWLLEEITKWSERVQDSDSRYTNYAP